jgi:hypothetical protein
MSANKMLCTILVFLYSLAVPGTLVPGMSQAGTAKRPALHAADSSPVKSKTAIPPFFQRFVKAAKIPAHCHGLPSHPRIHDNEKCGQLLRLFGSSKISLLEIPSAHSDRAPPFSESV